MTHEEFLTSMELYYGKYNEFQKNVLKSFLWHYFSEKDLKTFSRITYCEYSTKWKMPPDIAIFWEIIKEHNDGLPYNEKIGVGNNECKKTFEIENNDFKNEVTN